MSSGCVQDIRTLRGCEDVPAKAEPLHPDTEPAQAKSQRPLIRIPAVRRDVYGAKLVFHFPDVVHREAPVMVCRISINRSASERK